jgi:hypothetical protein
MAISRAQLAKELEPGLNALFGLEYNRYENEHAEIFEEESSDRAFEEEVMLGGFSTAPVKSEGGTSISFDDAQETFTPLVTHTKPSRLHSRLQKRLSKITFMIDLLRDTPRLLHVQWPRQSKSRQLLF